jgi:SET domain-containing protein
MLKVKTKVDKSQIHVLGLFAEDFIPKGSLIFEEDIFTLKIDWFTFEYMSEIERDFIDHYCYCRDNIWRCSVDNDRFMNHSDSPNTYEDGPYTYASKDINPGEEITCNYHSLCQEFSATYLSN